jgi:RimJ/RimL family protein N-acetyltransferase
VLHPEYPIRTGRLALRPWRMDDLDRYHQLRGDPEIARYLYDEPMDRVEATDRLGGLVSEIAAPGAWMDLAVEVVSGGEGRTGTVAGNVGLCWTSDVHGQAEIGYALLSDCRGHGFATEAARAVVDLAFTGLDVHRVSGRIDARNGASAGVLERLGMRREAHLVENEFVKGEWVDEAVYAVLADEWRSR